VTIRDYTNDLVFKGLTIHAIIGRRVFDTWIKMLDLFRAGLDVEDLVTNEFEGLEKFHEAMELLDDPRHESRFLSGRRPDMPSKPPSPTPARG
jgi:threonine dehydrogenase-like Zn-dependent dehydrogenase